MPVARKVWQLIFVFDAGVSRAAAQSWALIYLTQPTPSD
jgi:hypothetical protein